MSSRWWTTGEVIVVLVLVAAWSAGYIGVADELQALPDFRRAATLDLYRTDNRLWLGYALGLASVAVLPVQRFAPFKVFLATSALVAATGWWFSYLAIEGFALEGAVVVGAFWAVSATGRWRVVVVVAVASFVIANVGRYQVNDKLDALGGETSGWVGPTSRLAALALLLGVSLAGAYFLRGDESA